MRSVRARFERLNPILDSVKLLIRLLHLPNQDIIRLRRLLPSILERSATSLRVAELTLVIALREGLQLRRLDRALTESVVGLGRFGFHGQGFFAVSGRPELLDSLRLMVLSLMRVCPDISAELAS